MNFRTTKFREHCRCSKIYINNHFKKNKNFNKLRKITVYIVVK